MSQLNISLVQHELYWEAPEQNRNSLTTAIAKLKQTDLIILPEMFTTGFTMNVSEQAEEMEGPTHVWMYQMAQQHQAVICGSIIVKEKNQYFNRLLWMLPDGNYEYYDKKHLFSMAGEDEYFEAGAQRLITQLKGWKICPLICYDLRFPVWSRNTTPSHGYQYDLLIYIANWPSPRTSAWEKLLDARAIENLCYVAGVNRIGKDGKGLTYNGASRLIDMKGNTLLSGDRNEAFVKSFTIDLTELNKFRAKFPAIKDADPFQLI